MIGQEKVRVGIIEPGSLARFTLPRYARSRRRRSPRCGSHAREVRRVRAGTRRARFRSSAWTRYSTPTSSTLSASARPTPSSAGCRGMRRARRPRDRRKAVHPNVGGRRPAIAAACQHGTKLSVIFQRRWYRAPSGFARQSTRSTWSPILAECIIEFWRGKDYYDLAAWRGRWDTEGGGVIMNQAPHMLDLLELVHGASCRAVLLLG